MTADIVQYEDNRAVQAQAPIPAPLAHGATDPTGGRLVAWARGMQAAHQIGSALCETAFVPQAFRNKPEDAAAAILFGDEIGFTPTQALRSIYVIGGTPALYSRAQVAIVLSHGHEIWTVEDGPGKVTVSGRRRGTKHVETVTWTTARAQTAGYTSNKKYNTDSQAMLYARAAGDVARRIAPDVLAGCPYSVEELEMDEAPATSTVTRTATTAKVKRAAPAEKPVAAEPDLDDPPPAAKEHAEPDEPTTPAISAAQSKMLHALLRENGITDRALALALCSDVTGREIESTKELSKVDASAVIDRLNEMKDVGAADTAGAADEFSTGFGDDGEPA